MPILDRSPERRVNQTPLIVAMLVSDKDLKWGERQGENEDSLIKVRDQQNDEAHSLPSRQLQIVMDMHLDQPPKMNSEFAVPDEIMLENQVAGACVYPSIMLHKKRTPENRSDILAACHKYKQQFLPRLTKNIIEWLQSPKFTESMIDVDMRMKIRSFSFDSNVWMAIVHKYWTGKATKIKFTMPNNVIVIASTVICGKDKRDFMKKFRELHNERFEVYYLCIECLFYGTKRDRFLFKIGKITNYHKEKTHAFLTNSSENNSYLERAVKDFGVRVTTCGQMEKNRLFPIRQPFYLTHPFHGLIKLKTKCNFSITLSPFHELDIEHDFGGKKCKKQVKMAQTVTNSSERSSEGKDIIQNPNTVTLVNNYSQTAANSSERSSSVSIQGSFEHDNPYDQDIISLLQDPVPVTVKIPVNNYSQTVRIANPFFFREVLTRKVLPPKCFWHGERNELFLTIDSTEAVIACPLHGEQLQEIAVGMIRHVDGATGEFPRIPCPSTADFDGNPLRVLESLMINNLHLQY
uniref:Uncharacterized protein n=1 Tax=Strigamia maritima TaxID=126957 RepID=T1J0C2_STRMM